MQESHNHILPDHQEMLIDIFDHITYLINTEQLHNASEEMLNLHYADLADYLDNLNDNLYHTIVPLLAAGINPQTIVCLNNSNKQNVIESLGAKHSARLINQMDIEDAIDVIENLNQDTKDNIFPTLTPDRQQQILEGFTYPENTVGRILEKNFIAFQEHWTSGQAIDHIRRCNIAQDFHAAIVVNTKNKPVGTILLSTLLKADRTSPINALMNAEYKVASVYETVDELAFIFKQYALTIVPVINKVGKLVGTVSIDNMLYIVEEKTESEFLQLGGISTSDIFDNSYETAKLRFPWLFFNLLTSCATSMIINQFSDTIAKIVALATLMPIVAAMGGNVAIQTLTVTVRALANREVTKSNMLKVIINEILSSSFNGIVLASLAGLLSYFLFSDMYLSMVFITAIIINFIVAGLFGSGLPITLNNFDIDPATASGVCVTAITDAIGFFSFLGLAYLLLV